MCYECILTDLIKNSTIENLLLFTLCAYSGLYFMVFLQLDLKIPFGLMPQTKPRYVSMISDTHYAILKQLCAVKFLLGTCKTTTVSLF